MDERLVERVAAYLYESAWRISSGDEAQPPYAEAPGRLKRIYQKQALGLLALPEIATALRLAPLGAAYFSPTALESDEFLAAVAAYRAARAGP